MHKCTETVALALSVCTLFLGALVAQQTPAATSKSTTGAKTASTTKTGTAAKPHTGSTAAAKPLTLTTDRQKQSYAIGMSIGSSLKRDQMDLDPAIVSQAVKDSLAGGKTLLTEAEAKDILTKLRNEVMAKRQTEMQQQSDKNKAAGQQFLAANKTKEGVVTLPDGLQYKVVKEGSGPKPTANDTVSCNYRGTLIDGTEFDSSAKHGGPVSFPVGQVIKGWSEALQLMPVGSKWQLFVPADLAYGERSPGPEIGPNSTLVFDIDLVSIKGKEESKDKAQ